MLKSAETVPFLRLQACHPSYRLLEDVGVQGEGVYAVKGAASRHPLYRLPSGQGAPFNL